MTFQLPDRPFFGRLQCALAHTQTVKGDICRGPKIYARLQIARARVIVIAIVMTVC